MRIRPRHLAAIALLLIFGISVRSDPSEVNADRIQIKTSKNANVFTFDDAVVFHVPEPAAQTYGWRVRDWQGNLCGEGILPKGDSEFEIEDLPPGYFEVELKGETEARWQPPVPFARIAPPAARVYNPQSPFAVDSAQSWLASKGHRGNKLDPENPFEVITELEHLAGLTMVRDRMGWNDLTNPAPGRHNWEPYDTNATLLSQRGIEVYSLYESYPRRPAPAWTEGGIRDLAAIHRFSEEAGRHFAGRITAWEFWNEPDLKRDISTWDFAAAQKAAWLGFKRAAPDINVLNGSLSNIHRFAGVLDSLLENGIGPYFDTYNLHTYLIPRHQHRVMSATRETLARHAQDHKPVWVTEVGYAYEGNGERAPLQSGSENREHGPEQARAQAERVVTAEVTLHALGADRVFFFVMPPYNEAGGGKVWGLLRWDWLVKPGYVALANLTAQLSDARLLGSWNAGEGVTAWLFEQRGSVPLQAREGTQTLVLWSGVSQTLRLAFPEEQTGLELVDLVGKSMPLKPRSSGKSAGQYAIKVGTAPVYINGLRGLVPDSPARNHKMATKTTSDLRDKHSTILRVRLGSHFSDIGQLTVAFPETDTAEAIVDVFNFSDSEVRGVITNLGSGYELMPASSAPVVVPPMGSIPVPVKIRFAAESRTAVEATVLRIGGEFAGRSVAPVAIPILPDFDATLARCHSRSIDGATDTKNWQRNTSGSLDITTNPGADAAVSFRVRFPADADRWVHPYLKLEQGALAGAIGFSFEIKSAPGSKPARGILVLSDAVAPVDVVNGEQPDTPFEVTDQWQTVKVDFRRHPMYLRSEHVRIMRIGCNPVQSDFEYTIRNMKIHLAP